MEDICKRRKRKGFQGTITVNDYDVNKTRCLLSTVNTIPTSISDIYVLCPVSINEGNKAIYFVSRIINVLVGNTIVLSFFAL